MKVSYNELKKYFDENLLAPEALAEVLTFHAWEVEGQEKVGGDTVLDVKVLPDKSAWALSHRGIAKDISAIIHWPLTHDPLREQRVLEPITHEVVVSVTTPTCTRYNAALIKGIKVGPSPQWLIDFLTSIGQRSINNVVDITNYVMFGLGQPLHAFDAGKLSHTDGYKITVRAARNGEKITTLTGEAYSLTTNDTLIVDGDTDTPVGIAGIKGGKIAEVDANTVDIIVESAHFDALATRKSSQRLRLRTDASTRYENGVSRGLTTNGITEAVPLIIQECGGVLVGYVDTNPTPVTRAQVAVSLSKINSVLGVALGMHDVETIIKNWFGYQCNIDGDIISVLPPFERPDLVIAEDMIEEIGRVYGLEHIVSVPIEPIPLREINKRFYYAEALRDALTEIGFSEVFTSSFRDFDEVKLTNALASDKGYLRSEKGIIENMKDVLAKNAPNSDLFGTDQVCVFELGKVFEVEGERDVLVLGVWSKQGYVAKKDKKILDEAVSVLDSLLGVGVSEIGDGIIVIDVTTAVESLPQPTAYTHHEKTPDVMYRPFSIYPYSTRDIAFWASVDTTAEEAEKIIRENAGALAQRIDMFDRFEKEGRVSYGFRIVFQSYEKTLTASDSDAMMQAVSSAVSARGFEVR